MESPISKIQLQVIEKSLDKLFGKLNLDIEFTKHFFDRLNDERNGKQITPSELVQVYTSLYDKYGVDLSHTNIENDSELEELMKSISTDINIPLNIGYNRKNKKIELVAKTIMRKKNFKSPDKVLVVENKLKTFDEFLNEEVKLKIKWKNGSVIRSGVLGRTGQYFPEGYVKFQELSEPSLVFQIIELDSNGKVIDRPDFSKEILDKTDLRLKLRVRFFNNSLELLNTKGAYVDKVSKSVYNSIDIAKEAANKMLAQIDPPSKEWIDKFQRS